MFLILKKAEHNFKGLNMNENILEVKNLNVYFREKNNNIKIIDNVSFCIKEGECLGILGESGSGKSMTIKSILRLLDNNFYVEGEAFFNDIDLIKESAGNIRKLRGNDIWNNSDYITWHRVFPNPSNFLRSCLTTCGGPGILWR